jgi:hypothetical protein
MDPKVKTALEKIVKRQNVGSEKLVTAAYAAIGFERRKGLVWSHEAKDLGLRFYMPTRAEKTLTGFPQHVEFVDADTAERYAANMRRYLRTPDVDTFPTAEGLWLARVDVEANGPGAWKPFVVILEGLVAVEGIQVTGPGVAVGQPELWGVPGEHERQAAATRAIRAAAAAALGIELPEDAERRREEGFDAPAVDPRKTTYRTCQACFNAQAVQHGTLVHHGYRRPGWGYIVGDCAGVHDLPFEVSCDLTRKYLTGVEERAAQTLTFLRKARAGKLDKVMIRVKVSNKNGDLKYDYPEIGPDDPRFAKGVADAIERAEYVLRMQWSGHFGSVPWYRAVVRTWAPSATGPVGAPRPALIDEDFAGMPKEAAQRGR